MNPILQEYAARGLAQNVLRDCGMETGESAESPTTLLGRHKEILSASRLSKRGEAGRRLHIGRHLGDVVAVTTVAVCQADPEACRRAVVSYADGTRSMHKDGLPANFGSLLEHMGIELTPTPCNHHGGEEIEAIHQA